MNPFFRITVRLLWILFFVNTGTAAIIVRQWPGGDQSSVPSVDFGAGTLVALPELFEQFGFTWNWEVAAQQLILRRNAQQCIFSQDVSFCSINDTIRQLLQAPERIGSTLYLPLSTVLEIVKAVTLPGQSVVWDKEQALLTISSTPHAILSVDCEKKTHGVLLTIALADSVPFDYTYDYPDVTLNFFGAAVDASQFRNIKRFSFIDSIVALQQKESAQISLALSSEIDEPQVDYLQDSHTLLISLVQKKGALQSQNPSPNPASTQRITTIVIDPGHGGKDPGAIGPDGVKEKDVALAIGIRLRDKLSEAGNIKIFLTRDKDVFVELAERTRMANEKKADLFVSIHANAVQDKEKKSGTTKGYKVYFLSQAKNEDDKLIAMQENAVIKLESRPQNYSALQNVLIDLAGNEYLQESQELSIMLDKSFETSLSKWVRKLHRGVGQANFWVLNGAYMPSVLIETGFISNPAEEKLLATSEVQQEMARAIRAAILSFKQKYEAGL